jgi:pyruvate/2-oxoglutarate dehydrogenase complex dihydrolipoamide acyltransferase (E2) component
VINDYNMDNALAFVKKCNADQQDVRVTMTAVMTLAAGWGIYKMRRDIGRLPFGTFKASKKLGVTVLVDVEGGRDLVPVTIWDSHKMSVIEVAKYINDRVQRAKKGNDETHNKSTNLANFIPSFIAQPIMFAATYIAAVCGVTIAPLSLRSDAFGHTVITNVGTLGYHSAIAPLCPLVHAISLLCTGAIEKRVIVGENDEIKIANMMTCVGTGDHRYGDAAIFIPFFSAFRGYIEDPANFDHTKYKDVPHYKELKSK